MSSPGQRIGFRPAKAMKWLVAPLSVLAFIAGAIVPGLIRTAVAADPATLTLSPGSAINSAGIEHCVTATVTDAFAVPVPAVSVHFSVSGANASSGQQTTDAAGQASFCYTGTSAGTDTITAFADTDASGAQNGAEPGDSAGKTYVAADPATLALSPASATSTAGVQHCVTATVKDAFQNPNPNVSVPFTVTGANASSGQQTTDAAGQATFCYTGTSAGTDTITAFADSDGSTTQNGTEPGDSVTKTYVAAAPATLALSPQSAINGAGEEHCVTATVKDAFQNPNPNVSVRFSVTGANTAAGQATTGGMGRAGFCYTGTAVGTDTIAAFADTDGSTTQNGGEPGDTATKTYVAAAAATLVLAPQSAVSDAGAQHCVTATVHDSFGNLVRGVIVRFTVAGANVANGQRSTGATGQAGFCYAGTSTGTDTIGAFADTDGSGAQNGSEPGDSATKTWRAAAPAALTLVPAADTVAAGSERCVTATVRDAYGNVARDVIVRFSASGANTAAGQDTTGLGGKASFCYTGTTVGTDTIEAFADTDASGGQSLTEPGESATKTWKAAAPATLTVTPPSGTGAAGTAHCLTATVRDAFGNAARGIAVQFSVTGANTTAGQQTSGAGGGARFCYTGTSAGSDTIAAFADTDASGAQNGAEPGDSATKTWRAAAPAALTLGPPAGAGPAGVEQCLTATVRDLFGNLVRDVIVRFSASGANTAAGQGTTGAGGRTTFCYTGTTVGTDTVDAFGDTDRNGTRNGAEPADSATKVWKAGPPATLTLAPPSGTSTAGTAHCLTATVRDGFGNAARGVVVRFLVTGANTGGGQQTSGAAGGARFCYTGTKAGLDTISAFADTNGNGAQNGGEPGDTAAKTYVAAAPASLTLAPSTGHDAAGTAHCVTATVRDAFGNNAPGVSIRYSVTGANTASGQKTSGSAGRASFCYTGTKVGADTISAFADTDGSGTQSGSEPGDSASNTYAAAAPATMTLTPPTATNRVGSEHCLTATVRDSFGNPTSGVIVRFSVTGPNPASDQQSTGAGGRASFCYTGTKTGTDTVAAFADTDGSGARNGSEPGDSATKTWSAAAPAVLALAPPASTGPAGSEHCLTATVRDAFGNLVSGVTVRFSVSGANAGGGDGTTGTGGRATFCYTGTNAGTDTIDAFADTNGNGVRNGTEPDDRATRTWSA